MGQRLRVVLSETAGTPIYEQIKSQIKDAILAGDLAEGERLPSIRALARDLRVSVITTTRAFTDLAAEGFVVNVQGKGSFVLARDAEVVREHVLRDVEGHLGAAVRAARVGHLDPSELHALLDLALGTDARTPRTKGTW